MTTTTLKRGERTRLVTDYLKQNPKATKKEVMEKFEVSDATFYNIRKKLNGTDAKDATKQTRKPAVRPATKRANKPAASRTFSVSCYIPQMGCDATFTSEGLKLGKCLINWKQLKGLTESGLFS